MIRDDFEIDYAPGTVVGSPATSGAERLGIDAERTIAVDNGALRIGFLETPGWGREAIAYGPFERERGVALSALALNGHNSSQVCPPSGGNGLRTRARNILRSRRSRSDGPSELSENFAVGWGTGAPEAGQRPTGSLLMIRPVVAQSADLCACIQGEVVPLLRRLRNVPVLYVVALRERGAVYYAASLGGVPGLPAQPLMRPLAIDPDGSDSSLIATVHQAVLAEVGWRVDSRVSAVRVERVAELGDEHGSAHVADPSPSPGALVDPGLPSGLLHLRVAAAGTGSGIVWRAAGAGDRFAIVLGEDGATLTVREGGVEEELARDPTISCGEGAHLQVLDDGEEITVLAGTSVAFGGPLRDRRLAAATSVGVVSEGGAVADFEAHPRAVAIPPALDPGPPWDQRGAEAEIVDRFEGPAGELGVPWVRREGKGRILCSGQGGARIDAERTRPNPGRLIYTRPWPHPEFAEISVEQTPPGREEGEGENGRMGLVLMQDPDNYLIINIWLDDAYSGTSISSFLTLDGHEDHFRAVWCNVGRTVRWGVRSSLGIASDGMRWVARVDGEPVLHRALSDVYPRARRLQINEVGIAANWEYGDDTGTQVHEFSARKRSA